VSKLISHKEREQEEFAAPIRNTINPNLIAMPKKAEVSPENEVIQQDNNIIGDSFMQNYQTSYAQVDSVNQPDSMNYRVSSHSNNDHYVSSDSEIQKILEENKRLKESLEKKESQMENLVISYKGSQESKSKQMEDIIEELEKKVHVFEEENKRLSIQLQHN
jgi:hypothetical protein